MYAVIDKHSLPAIADRAKAELLLTNLKRDNADANWQVFVAIETQPLEVLERLYALAGMLLQQSGLNPFELTLTLTRLDNREEEYNAVNIMSQARNWIDQVQQS